MSYACSAILHKKLHVKECFVILAYIHCSCFSLCSCHTYICYSIKRNEMTEDDMMMCTVCFESDLGERLVQHYR